MYPVLSSYLGFSGQPSFASDCPPVAAPRGVCGYDAPSIEDNQWAGCWKAPDDPTTGQTVPRRIAISITPSESTSPPGFRSGYLGK